MLICFYTTSRLKKKFFLIPDRLLGTKSGWWWWRQFKIQDKLYPTFFCLEHFHNSFSLTRTRLCSRSIGSFLMASKVSSKNTCVSVCITWRGSSFGGLALPSANSHNPWWSLFLSRHVQEELVFRVFGGNATGRRDCWNQNFYYFCMRKIFGCHLCTYCIYWPKSAGHKNARIKKWSPIPRRTGVVISTWGWDVSICTLIHNVSPLYIYISHLFVHNHYIRGGGKEALVCMD